MSKDCWIADVKQGSKLYEVLSSSGLDSGSPPKGGKIIELITGPQSSREVETRKGRGNEEYYEIIGRSISAIHIIATLQADRGRIPCGTSGDGVCIGCVFIYAK